MSKIIEKRLIFLLIILFCNSAVNASGISTPSLGIYNYSNSSYFITWLMPQTTSLKRVLLYYDNDDNPAEKILITDTECAGIVEKGEYIWNTGNIPSGDYYIHLYIQTLELGNLYVISHLPVKIRNYSDKISLITTTDTIDIVNKSVVLNAADLNNDGIEDLIFTGTYEYTDIFGILAEIYSPEHFEYKLQNYNGDFYGGASIEISGNRITGGLSAVDFNSDGKIDIAVSVTKLVAGLPNPRSSAHVFMYKQNAPLAFSSPVEYDLPPVASGAFSLNMATEISAVDFNGDSLPDFAALQYNFADTSQNGKLHIFIQNSSGVFSEKTIGGFNTPPAPYRLCINDFNNDYKMDIAVICKYSNKIMIYYQGTDGQVSDSREIDAGNQPVTLKAIDINGDHLQDFAVSLKGENKIRIFKQLQNQSFQIFCDIPTMQNPQGIEIYDYNLDSLEDIAVSSGTGSDSKYLTIFKQLSGDTFIEAVNLGLPYFPLDIKIFADMRTSRPGLAVMTYDNKMLIHRSLPLNNPPVLAGWNIPDTLTAVSTGFIKVVDYNNEPLTISIFQDTDNIGFDGRNLITINSFIPYDSIVYLIKSDSFIADSIYLYAHISDGIDTNSYYYGHQLFKPRADTGVTSLEKLFDVTVNWNPSATVISDTMLLELYDTTNIRIIITINGIIYSDSTLITADSKMLFLFNWDSGYYEINVTAISDSKSQSVDYVLVRNLPAINLSAVDTAAVIEKDSGAFLIASTPLSDSIVISGLFVNTAGGSETVRLSLIDDYYETRVVSVIQKDSEIFIPKISDKFILCDSAIFSFRYNYFRDTTLVSPDTANDFFGIRLESDSMVFSAEKYKIYYYNPISGTGRFIGYYELNSIKDIINSSEKFYLAVYYNSEELPASSIRNIIIYPNPWVPDDNDNSNGTYQSGIYFRNLIIGDAVKIYNFNAELTFTFDFLRNDIDYYNWNCKDRRGNSVSSGVYFAVIKNGRDTFVKKILIIK